MKRTLSALLSSTAMIAIVATPALSQSAAQPGAQTQGQASTTQPQQGQPLDARQASNQQKLTAAEFVRKAAIGNLFEIRSGELAIDKSGNQAVQDFAETLIDDHQSAGEELAEAANDIDVPAQLDKQHADMISRLEQTSGDQFDRQFIRMQIRAHREAVSLYRSFLQQDGRQNVTAATSAQNRTEAHPAELQAFARETLPKLEEHLQTAQQLRRQLRQEDGVAARQNRQDEAAEPRRSSLNIQQQSPQVTVSRRSPQVSVQQAQPQIVIRQAPPTVTIQQPPPEVTVRMPRPDVNVESPRPQVSVNVPRPQVRFQQSNAEPRIQYQEADDGDRQFEYQRAQPEVDYQRTGEPRVIYQQADREPTVRYESQQSRGEKQRLGMQSVRGTKGQQADRNWIGEARRMTAGDAADESTTTGAGTDVQSQRLTVSQLTDMDIYNAQGENLGSVDDVVMDSASDRAYVVLAHGGFLGMFQDEVALPVNRLRYRGNRLIVSGLTEQEISDMPHWRSRVSQPRQLDDSRTVEIRR